MKNNYNNQTFCKHDQKKFHYKSTVMKNTYSVLFIKFSYICTKRAYYEK